MDSLRVMSQAAVIDALAAFADRWRDPASEWRRRAEQMAEPFPFAMTCITLDAVLASLSPQALWAWIDAEGVRDAFGAPVIGHVIAGNTPLLAWTSVLRALLMRGASRVKLPSGNAALWGRLFWESLAAVSPPLAASIVMDEWPGGSPESRAREAAFCRDVDVLLVYGGDRAIDAWRQLCPEGTRLIGYGHRVSCAVVLEGADWSEAATGLARDVLLYDQGGCLSPQTVFVEGGADRARVFGPVLAAALADVVGQFPLPTRPPAAASRVRAARALARMEGADALWEDPALRWTVIARPEPRFAPSPTHGVISVQPLESLAALPEALILVRDALQGCAAAGPGAEAAVSNANFGFSYVCAPGALQAPPLSWPQDHIPPLRSLRAGITRKFGPAA